MNSKKQIPSCNDCKNSSTVFCSLSKIEKTTLSENKGNKFYKKGQTIFSEGNQSRGLFCVFDGKIKLSKLGEEGKEQILRFAKTGNIVGYSALFNNSPYESTAIAIEDSYICHLSKDRFISILKQNSNLSWSVFQLLSNDLKIAEQNVLNIAQKTVRARVIATIILLQDVFGFMNDDKSLDVTLSRTEIADVAGTTTESTIRTLKQLQKEGLIILKRKIILIPVLKDLIKANGISIA